MAFTSALQPNVVLTVGIHVASRYGPHQPSNKSLTYMYTTALASFAQTRCFRSPLIGKGSLDQSKARIGLGMITPRSYWRALHGLGTCCHKYMVDAVYHTAPKSDTEASRLMVTSFPVSWEYVLVKHRKFKIDTPHCSTMMAAPLNPRMI